MPEAILVRRGVVYAGGLLCLLVMTSTAALQPQALWTYFTNWNFLVQYASYISVLESSDKRQWLVDLGTLIVWTVAVSYSVVLIVSMNALDVLYNIYGFWPFWLGNFFIHYLPAIINTVGIRSPVQSLYERTYVFLVLTALIVFYNITHDTRKIYFSDVMGPYEGMGYMILAGFLLQVSLDFSPCFPFFVLIPKPPKVYRFRFQIVYMHPLCLDMAKDEKTSFTCKP